MITTFIQKKKGETFVENCNSSTKISTIATTEQSIENFSSVTFTYLHVM